MKNMFARVHVWLGWIVGIPLLLWTGTGLFMVAQPIETVRGEYLKRPAPPLVLTGAVVAPATGPRPVKSLALEMRPDGPKWVITFGDGEARLGDPATGRLLPPINGATAATIARASFAGPAALQGLTRTSAAAPPLDLRRNRPTWRATFTDGTRIYIDADTGAVLATRTTLWRIFDFMWGLHIMDIQTRENSSHPVLIGFAAVTFLSILIGLILLPLRRRRRPGS